MNTTMAYGAEQRLDAQIAEALFGQPGMSKMDVANRVRELRGDGPALLVGGRRFHQVSQVVEHFGMAVTPEEMGAAIASAPSSRFSTESAAAAFSNVQPSPGGQGDALPPVREDEPLRGDEPIGEQHDARMFNRGWNACREAAAALAARQPVGQEPVAPKKMARAVALDLMHAVYEHHGWKRAEGESMTARVNSLYDVTLEAGRNRFVATPKPAAPPAQAVDLGQFHALAAFGEEFAFSAEKQPQSRVIYAQARRLLALIDGKAVGHG